MNTQPFEIAFAPGVKIDVFSFDNREWRTTVFENEGKSLGVFAPKVDKALLPPSLNDVKGKNEPVWQKGERFTLCAYNDSGRYLIEGECDGVWKNDPTMLHLRVQGDMKREQRRESFRLPVGRRVDLRSDYYGEETAGGEALLETAITSNISATGLAVLAKRPYNAEAKLSMLLFLNFPTPTSDPIRLDGVVRSCKLFDQKKRLFLLGVQINPPDPRDTAARAGLQTLTKFVRAEELEAVRRMRALRDGDDL